MYYVSLIVFTLFGKSYVQYYYINGVTINVRGKVHNLKLNKTQNVTVQVLKYCNIDE
jgi:hypothetical protein